MQDSQILGIFIHGSKSRGVMRRSRQIDLVLELKHLVAQFYGLEDASKRKRFYDRIYGVRKMKSFT